MKHIVAVSGGKDSTALALRLAEVEPRDYIYVCTPTGDEPDELFAHLVSLGEILGKKILPVVHPLGLNGLIEEQDALPNWRMRWCTRALKIEPFREFLARNLPATCYVGLRADEEDRIGGVYGDMSGVSQRFPFREWDWNVSDVWDYLGRRGISIPKRTDCNRCFFQTLHEWHALWKDNPLVYADAERQEEETGHTFRSAQRDTQPTSLKELRLKFEQGYAPKERKRLVAAMCRACTL